MIQSKQVYYNYFFAAKNCKKGSIVRKNMKINTECEFFTQISKKKTIS